MLVSTADGLSARSEMHPRQRVSRAISQFDKQLTLQMEAAQDQHDLEVKGLQSTLSTAQQQVGALTA